MNSLAKSMSRTLFGSPIYWMRLNNHRLLIGRLLALLSLVDEKYDSLSSHMSKLAPDKKKKQGLFEEIVTGISQSFTRIKSIPMERLSSLSSEETERLDEAYHCFVEKCYWSSIVSSSAALESRLFLILTRRNEQALAEKNPSFRFPLGALASAYIEDSKAFSNCIPPVHENLLKLVNAYRIVSAHAKQFKVDRRMASSVFSLTLAFLLDEDCEPPKKKLHPRKVQQGPSSQSR